MYQTLFDFSQKELSQDAFLAWLFQFADENVKKEYISITGKPTKEVMNLGKCAVDILRLFTGIDTLEPKTIKVEKQREKIDVWVEIDSKFSLIIEDKTETGEHDDQLSTYKKTAGKWCKKNNQQLFCCYYKTEFVTPEERKSVERQGYKVCERNDVLTILKKYKETILQNDITESYYSFIEKKENEEASFLTTKRDTWTWDQHVGFFRELDSFFLDEYRDCGYVNNPSGGFNHFCWHFCSLKDKVQLYLQFEDHKLCIKICDVYKNRSETRTTMVEKMNSLAEKYQLEIEKPRRYGCGESMTLGIVNPKHWFAENKNGFIDIDETKEKLVKLMEFVDDLAKKN